MVNAGVPEIRRSRLLLLPEVVALRRRMRLVCWVEETIEKPRRRAGKACGGAQSAALPRLCQGLTENDVEKLSFINGATLALRTAACTQDSAPPAPLTETERTLPSD